MLQTPFSLDNHAAYEQWRDQKLAHYPASAGDLIVEVGDPENLSPAEHGAITALCRKTNMAIYVGQRQLTGKEGMLNVARQFGLMNLDKHLCADDEGVSALCDDPEAQKNEYIPYTNKAINWHTDGYYNPPDRQIRAMMLHCIRQAETGGGNQLLDHELLYIKLRDRNPDYIKALMQPGVMTIPANIQDGREIRPALTGPVFSITGSGDLHLRYTARTRSIEWQQDALTLEAVAGLEAVLASDDIHKYQLRLAPGQGLICNNVLHTRTAFEDSEQYQRLVYRIRSYDRITGTSMND